MDSKALILRKQVAKLLEDLTSENSSFNGDKRLKDLITLQLILIDEKLEEMIAA